MAGKAVKVAMTVNGVRETIHRFEGLEQAAGSSPRWVVGTAVEYAVYLETGTSRMPPYPFLRPAVEYVMQSKADSIADNASSIDELIENLAMAIERRAKHYATSGVDPGPDVQTGNLRSSIKAERVN